MNNLSDPVDAGEWAKRAEVAEFEVLRLQRLIDRTVKELDRLLEKLHTIHP